ncbi:hypothetical protein MHI18_12735 [Peribacillus sp. FSL H8-0477]|uniref:hypothetical protein n=1 Tax=Peribacillus sp. FSL H8-0477 TaxID=2921388 RepID=UPI0030FCCDF0
MKNDSRDIIYIHLQASERFALFSGMSFREFGHSTEVPLSNLLLLKHRYEEGEFNLNTLLEYVPEDRVGEILKEDVDEYGDFCWLDFEEESGLDELDGQEIAELLYLGHCKHHLRPPFFRKLKNQYVYLAHDDGWFNKLYYRTLSSYLHLIGNVLPLKLESVTIERTWLGFKKKSEIPKVPDEILAHLTPLMAEGLILSFSKAQQTRQKIEIPGWVIGDYVNMDDMMESYKEMSADHPHIQIIYYRKTKEWAIIKK